MCTFSYFKNSTSILWTMLELIIHGEGIRSTFYCLVNTIQKVFTILFFHYKI